MFSTVGDIMMHVGDIMSTVGERGCSVPWGYHEYHGRYHDACGGYLEYSGVMIPLKWRNSSRILSTSHFMIAILVSAFEILSVPASTRLQYYRFSETKLEIKLLLGTFVESSNGVESSSSTRWASCEYSG